MLKFAKNRVAGWNQRHVDTIRVYKLLLRRIELGYTLTMDERQFIDDVNSLIKQYNTI
jgi:hypothetical protein